MNQSNEIALQLVNNYTEDINIALFPNVNNAQFVQSQTEETVQAQYYKVGNTIYPLDDVIIIQQKNKKTNIIIPLTIPYVGPPGFESDFDPDFFVLFCINWFSQNGYGYVFGSAPDMIIYSDLYEYGNLDIPEA